MFSLIRSPHLRGVFARRRRAMWLVMAVTLTLVSQTACSFFPQQGEHTTSVWPLTSSVIAAENAKPGTTDWVVTQSELANSQIEAYASATSVQVGETLRLYVSTKNDYTPYTLDVFRLGWYRGLGGRLMYQAKETGRAQGYYNTNALAVTACPACAFNSQTKLLEANWTPSVTLTVPANWLSGVYEAKFTTSNGSQYYLNFDVRSNAHTTYIVITDDTTVAAYNHWGGYSLYTGPDNTYNSRAYAVSLDRPVDSQDIHGLPFEINAIRWLEWNSYDVSYMSSVDLQEHAERLLNHRVYISLGHDEYWSWEMRQGVLTARDSGISLLFMGADAGDWQIRFAPSSAGVTDRVIICYKQGYLDPLWKVNNARVTVKWREAPVSLPENAFRGVMTSSYSLHPPGYPWYLDARAISSPLLAGTGLTTATPYGCQVVGYEWDKVVDNGLNPPGLIVLGTSPTVDFQGHRDISNTVYYMANPNALVFSSGSIQWSYALDTLRLYTSGLEGCGHAIAVPGIQRLMANIMSKARGS